MPNVTSGGNQAHLVRIEGKMYRAKYGEILDENLLQSAQDLRLGTSPSNRKIAAKDASTEY